MDNRPLGLRRSPPFVESLGRLPCQSTNMRQTDNPYSPPRDDAHETRRPLRCMPWFAFPTLLGLFAALSLRHNLSNLVGDAIASPIRFLTFCATVEFVAVLVSLLGYNRHHLHITKLANRSIRFSGGFVFGFAAVYLHVLSRFVSDNVSGLAFLRTIDVIMHRLSPNNRMHMHGRPRHCRS